jgi:hypothetical protein
MIDGGWVHREWLDKQIGPPVTFSNGLTDELPKDLDRVTLSGDYVWIPEESVTWLLGERPPGAARSHSTEGPATS